MLVGIACFIYPHHSLKLATVLPSLLLFRRSGARKRSRRNQRTRRGTAFSDMFLNMFRAVFQISEVQKASTEQTMLGKLAVACVVSETSPKTRVGWKGCKSWQKRNCWQNAMGQAGPAACAAKGPKHHYLCSLQKTILFKGTPRNTIFYTDYCSPFMGILHIHSRGILRSVEIFAFFQFLALKERSKEALRLQLQQLQEQVGRVWWRLAKLLRKFDWQGLNSIFEPESSFTRVKWHASGMEARVSR